MKIGPYDLGTPVEFGLTSENQFYYPGGIGMPSYISFASYMILWNQEKYNPGSDFFVRDYPYNAAIGQYGAGISPSVEASNIMSWKELTSAFDTEQQYLSPGTAFGYGTLNETKQKPLGRKTFGPDFDNSQAAAGPLLESYFEYTGFRVAQGQNTILPYSPSINPTGAGSEYGTTDYEYFPFIKTRYNALYHSSLYSEIIMHNLNVASVNGNLPSTDYASVVDNLTQFLFGGKNLNPNHSSPSIALAQAPFKFVESGLPYVKFEIPGSVKHQGSSVSTSDNDHGKIYFYMLFNTFNHLGITNPDDIQPNLSPDSQFPLFSLASNTGLGGVNEVYDYLNELNFNYNNYAELMSLFNNNDIMIPTIIADFRDPVYNVEWSDTEVQNPDKTNIASQRRQIYPLPGQYNPGNDSFKGPNSGWCALSALPQNDADETTRLQIDRKSYNMSFKYIGCQPEYFTIDNLFLQDYDIQNRVSGNDIWYQYRNSFLANIGTIADDWANLYSSILATDNYNQETADKIFVMMNRVAFIANNWPDNLSAIETPERGPHWDGGTDIFGYYPPNPLDDPQGLSHNGSLYDASYSGYYGQNVPKMLKRLGPPAPNGYVPKCGSNYQNYFGIDVEVGTGAQLGNTNFEFNGGLKIGSIENLEALLGFDLSTLVEEFELSEFTDPDAAALNIFDREIHKKFYNVFTKLPSIERKAYQYYEIQKYPEELLIPVKALSDDGNYAVVDLFWNYDSIEINWDNTPMIMQSGDTDIYNNTQEGMNPNFAPNFINILRFAPESNDGVLLTEDKINANGFLDTSQDGGYTTDQVFSRLFDNTRPDIRGGVNSSGVPYKFTLTSGTETLRLERGRCYRFIFDSYQQQLQEDVFAALSNTLDYTPQTEVFTSGPNAGFPFIRINNVTTFNETIYFDEDANLANNVYQIDDYPLTTDSFIPTDVAGALTRTATEWYNPEWPGHPDNTSNNTNNAIPYDVDLVSSPTWNAGYHRSPWHYSIEKLQQIAGSPTLTNSEYEDFIFVRKVCEGLANFNADWFYNDNEWQKIISIFFQGGIGTGETPPELAPQHWLNSSGISFNPYLNNDDNNGWTSAEYGPYKSHIRNRLNLLSFQYGGIDSWELVNFKDWLSSGCIDYFPNNPPVLIQPPPDVDPEVGGLPDFTYNSYDYQILNPEQANSDGFIEIQYYGPEIQLDGVPGNTWWKICDYLNQFPELTDGTIDFITPDSSAQGLFGDLVTGQLIYSSISFTNEQGDTIPKGFYPSDPTAQINSIIPFFSVTNQGSDNPPYTIRIKLDETLSSPIATTAFGPPPTQPGFAQGTSFYQMIYELVNEGITGPVIDAPDNDGLLTLTDGTNYFETYGDIRPFQLIQFAIQNNVMELLHYLIYSNFSILDESTTEEAANFIESPIATRIPPLAIGVFDGVTNVVRNYESTFGIRETLKDDTGYFSSTGGSSSEITDTIGETSLIGNQIFTQSINPTNTPYYHTLTRYEPSLAKSQEIFDVSWGHIAGSGSLVKNNGKSPSEAVYRQAANELIGTESGSFFSVSQSVYESLSIPNMDIIENIFLQYMSNNPDPDEYVYILRTKQKLQEGYPLQNNGQINLSGSDASGNGVTLKLRPSKFLPSDTQFMGSTFPISQQKYYLLFETTQEQAEVGLVGGGVFGYWFPDVGTWVLNKKIEEKLTGNPSATAVAAYGDGAPANNTLAPNGIAKNDKEYNNALKLANVLQNNGSNKTLEKIKKINYSYGPQKNTIAIIKLKTDQFNFTTNPTRFKDLGSEGQFDTFTSNSNLQTMTYNEHLELGPSAYITHITLYDKSGFEVAVAKLSKPIKKDFFAEVVIKILLSYG